MDDVYIIFDSRNKVTNVVADMELLQHLFNELGVYPDSGIGQTTKFHIAGGEYAGRVERWAVTS